MQSACPKLSGISSSESRNRFLISPVDPAVEDRLPPETPYLRAFLCKLAAGASNLDVDDLLQETMNRALKYQQSYDSQRPLRQWLHGIGFRVFLDARAKAQNSPVTMDPVTVAEQVSDPSQINGRARPNVKPLLSALDEPERSVMEHTYIHGKSIGEVAAELHMAVGTIKSHLHRARRRLAARFNVEDWL